MSLKRALLQNDGNLTDLKLIIQNKKVPLNKHTTVEDISDIQQHESQLVHLPLAETFTLFNQQGYFGLQSVQTGIIYGYYKGVELDDSLIEISVNNLPIETSILTGLSISRHNGEQLDNTQYIEIEIPGYIWSAGDREVLITASYKGTILFNQLKLTTLHLEDWLNEIASPIFDNVFFDMLALEHLHFASKLITLTEGIDSYYRESAIKYNLSNYFCSQSTVVSQTVKVSEEDKRLDEAKRYFSKQITLTSNANEKLALVKKCHEMFLNTDYLQSLFVATVTPYFCRVNEFSSLFFHYNHLIEEIYKIANWNSLWAKSTVLPWVIHNNDYSYADTLWLELNNNTNGWLNTESIEFSVSHLFQHAPHNAEVKLINHFITTLRNLGSDYWSRLFDKHLINGLCICLFNYRYLEKFQLDELADVCISFYGLCPDFWLKINQNKGDLPLELKTAKRYASIIFELAEEKHEDIPLNVLSYFTDKGNREAKILETSLIQQKMFKTTQTKDLVELSSNNLVRFSAFPSLQRNSDISEQLHLLKYAIQKGHKQSMSCLYTLQNEISKLFQENKIDSAELSKFTINSFNEKAQYLSFNLIAWAVKQANSDVMLLLELFSEQLEKYLNNVSNENHDIVPTLQSALSAIDEFIKQEGSQTLLKRHTNLLSGIKDKGLDYFPCPEQAINFPLETKSIHSDTIVVIYSCRKYLDDRIPAIRNTWIKDLQSKGIPYLILVGDGNDQVIDDVLALNVSDRYEDLPYKSLALFNWVLENTNFQYVLKIDDDCYLDVDEYFDSLSYRKFHYYGRIIHRPVGGTDRTWHHSKSQGQRAAKALDKSPEPAIYCDGGGAYTLSRLAMNKLKDVQNKPIGKRLISSSYMEDKLIGDLLATFEIYPNDEDYYTLIRRRNFGDAIPVNMWGNNFFSGKNSPTKLVHTDSALDMKLASSLKEEELIYPKKIWPTYCEAEIGTDTNQLELISDLHKTEALLLNKVVVVAVLYNEMIMMPHFLKHYREMGVKTFIFVDNLSTDGTREFLLQQEDVVLYSADTQYKNSHYGVEWQKAILSNHCIGKWAIVADADEFLVYPKCETEPIDEFLAKIEEKNVDCLFTAMIDMYPLGDLSEADFEKGSPFELAAYYDKEPLVQDAIGSGHFSNHKSYVSSLRHRLSNKAELSDFVSQKFAVIKYQPWMRFSEGLHFSVNTNVSSIKVAFCHFKYHAAFKAKVEREITRKQHYNNADEYQKYLELINESSGGFGGQEISLPYKNSAEFLKNIVGNN
jgi:hypothetical protein